MQRWIPTSLLSLLLIGACALATNPGENLESLQTEHWIIHYSTSEAEARQVGETLERTRSLFIEAFARIG